MQPAQTSTPVRSVPMGRKESAVISRAQLRQQRGVVERWTAFVVLFISFLGTIVALAGGWPSFLASLRALTPNWAAILGGACCPRTADFPSMALLRPAVHILGGACA